MYKKLKIVVLGTGCVGLSDAIVLARHHMEFIVDIAPGKVDLISPPFKIKKCVVSLDHEAQQRQLSSELHSGHNKVRKRKRRGMIVDSRYNGVLNDVAEKVYTTDLYRRD
ncbi:hypothetical protein [Ethanoligenens harbinense]|uniref:hypothetical protein n=1 Tax=Ethanoligenens harbinense TaxID=253239 RepID=UPI0010C01959|nr:hypothetical protein [Ethanoligenens harbinense]